MKYNNHHTLDNLFKTLTGLGWSCVKEENTYIGHLSSHLYRKASYNGAVIKIVKAIDLDSSRVGTIERYGVLFEGDLAVRFLGFEERVKNLWDTLEVRSTNLKYEENVNKLINFLEAEEV